MIAFKNSLIVFVQKDQHLGKKLTIMEKKLLSKYTLQLKAK